MHRVRTSWASVIVMILIVASACDTTPEPGVERGKALYGTCVPCHGSDGAGTQKLGAPAIAGLPQWYITAQLLKYQAAQRGSTPFDTIGIRMKSMSLSLNLEGDVESVAEYVAGMTPVPAAATFDAGNAEAGQMAFALCSACHGPTGEGNELLSAPPLVGQHDWYLLSQLQKFKNGQRGATPGDQSGATMRPNTLTMDDQAMLDVVAYIKTLN